MYSESSYKNYIFWIKLRQILLLVVFSIVGCLLGRLIGTYLVDVLLFDIKSLHISVTVSTLVFFFIACFLTRGTAKDVLDIYWKIAVLRKLTVISKKLDTIPDNKKESVKKIVKSIDKKIEEKIEDSETETDEELDEIVDDMIGE